MAPCGLVEFERERGGVYQIRYDRMFDRVVDNSKVLAAAGIGSASLTTMEQSLSSELSRFLEHGGNLACGPGAQARMDRLVGGCPALPSVACEKGALGVAKYLVRRVAG